MSDDNQGGKYFDLDERLSDKDRPRIKFKGQEYFIADLSAKDILLFSRRVQTKQEILAIREESWEQELEESIQSGGDVDMAVVEAKREEFAEELQSIFKETATLMFHQIVKDDTGADVLLTDGKVRTKPMPVKVAEKMTQREWLALQDTLQEINGVLDVQGNSEGNVTAGNVTS